MCLKRRTRTPTTHRPELGGCDNFVTPNFREIDCGVHGPNRVASKLAHKSPPQKDGFGELLKFAYRDDDDARWFAQIALSCRCCCSWCCRCLCRWCRLEWFKNRFAVSSVKNPDPNRQTVRGQSACLQLLTIHATTANPSRVGLHNFCKAWWRAVNEPQLASWSAGGEKRAYNPVGIDWNSLSSGESHVVVAVHTNPSLGWGVCWGETSVPSMCTYTLGGNKPPQHLRLFDGWP